MKRTRTAAAAAAILLGLVAGCAGLHEAIVSGADHVAANPPPANTDPPMDWAYWFGGLAAATLGILVDRRFYHGRHPKPVGGNGSG